jgi:hypothetical protein
LLIVRALGRRLRHTWMGGTRDDQQHGEHGERRTRTAGRPFSDIP